MTTRSALARSLCAAALAVAGLVLALWSPALVGGRARLEGRWKCSHDGLEGKVHFFRGQDGGDGVLRGHFSERDSGDPKTQAAVPVRRPDIAAVRRPAVLALAGPAAAPEHPARAIIRAGRITSGRSCSSSSGRVIAIPVGAPLPHVAVHVVQA